MQSFASPLPQPPHQSPTPQKSRTTFYTTPHKKGATIAYTHALSTKKTQKGRNYRLSSRKIFVESVESV